MTINCIHDTNYTNPKALQRRELLEGEIKEQNLDIIIWSATMMIPVKTGISKSMKRIVRFAKNHNFDEVCICEDDIHFTAPGAWQYFLDNKPEKFHLYLGGLYDGIPDKNNEVLKFNGLTLYIIHKSFYDVFLNADEKMNIDNWLTGLGRFVVCNPMVVRQHDIPSYNNKVIDHQSHLSRYKFYGS